MGAELRRRLHDRIQWIAERHLTGVTPDSFKLACTRLWFAYNFATFLSEVEAQMIVGQKDIDWEGHRLGRSFYTDPLITLTREMLTRARDYITNPTKWTTPSLSAAMVCGGPGQGKTELMRQLVTEIAAITKSANVHFRAQELTIGKEVKSEADLKELFASLESELVNTVTLDEVDKAPFNLARAFLATLEDQSPGNPFRRTFWIFGQSAHETFAAYQESAQKLFLEREDASLRDFLTRMKWGTLELPPLRFVPMQRVFSALGMMLSAGLSPERITKRWAWRFARDVSIGDNRHLRKCASEASVIDGDRLDLRSDASASPIAGEWPAPIGSQ